MFGIENYVGFILAGILLNVTPGADTIYIITRSVAQGKKAGLVSALGITTGGFCHTLLAALGLSVIVMTSAALFTLIKLLGAGYLVYIGVKMITQRAPLLADLSFNAEPLDVFKIYRQGVLTNVLNPKVALFFISFLPQFIRPEHAQRPLPFLILGGTFLTTGTIWCLFLAYSASAMTNTLRAKAHLGQWMQRASGTIFVGLGLQLAFKHRT